MYWFSSQTQYCHNVLITQSSGLTDGIVAFFNHHWVKNNSVMDGLIQGLTSREDKWRRRGAKRDIHDVKKVNFVRQRKERDKVVKEVEGCSPFPFLHSFYAMMLSTLSTIITLQICYPAIGIFRGLLRISLVYIQPITSQGKWYFNQSWCIILFNRHQTSNHDVLGTQSSNMIPRTTQFMFDSTIHDRKTERL